LLVIQDAVPHLILAMNQLIKLIIQLMQKQLYAKVMNKPAFYNAAIKIVKKVLQIWKHVQIIALRTINLEIRLSYFVFFVVFH